MDSFEKERLLNTGVSRTDATVLDLVIAFWLWIIESLKEFDLLLNPLHGGIVWDVLPIVVLSHCFVYLL